VEDGDVSSEKNHVVCGEVHASGRVGSEVRDRTKEERPELLPQVAATAWNRLSRIPMA